MNVLTDKEGNLFYHVMSTFHGSILGLKEIDSISNVTNPNALTYIIQAEPKNIDITLEVTNRDKNLTELLITQNSDSFNSERTVSFPTNELTDVETIRSLRNIIETQYKSDVMRTILHDAMPQYDFSSALETKDYHGKNRFVYTLWSHDKEPVRFIMNETLLDVPHFGGNLQYQEFNTFKKQWETKALYISEALMSTKERVERDETIVNAPTIYGDKWSMTDFITKNTSQRTMEQNLITAPLHQLTNLDPSMYDGVNLTTLHSDLLDQMNQDYNIAYKIPDLSENRISDVDVYIYPADKTLTEPNEHTKRFIMRYQHPTDDEPGYFKIYDPVEPEPKLIARKAHTTNATEDMILLTNHLKEISGPMIQKQVTKKQQLSRFSLNLPPIQEKRDELEL